jgi:hypothetical protein
MRWGKLSQKQLHLIASKKERRNMKRHSPKTLKRVCGPTSDESRKYSYQKIDVLTAAGVWCLASRKRANLFPARFTRSCRGGRANTFLNGIGIHI